MTDMILLFDGDCNLCNSVVKIVIKYDQKKKFKFASLQSTPGQAILKRFGLSTNSFDSVVYVVGNNYFTKSTAALKVAWALGGFWKVLYILIVFPKPIRNLAYDAIASNRYILFGKNKSCMVPTPEINCRFIDV